MERVGEQAEYIRRDLEDPPAEGESQGRRARLSRALVDLYKDVYGRGPVAVKVLLSADAAIAVLHGVLTPGEQTLLAGAKLTEVEQMRLRTAEVAKPRLIPAAEEALGAKVQVAVTGIGVLDDVATETFLLAPGKGSAVS